MNSYNIKSPATQGGNKIHLPTNSRQVTHRGQRLDNILDDAAAFQQSRNIVTYTDTASLGIVRNSDYPKLSDLPEIVIEKVPPNSICCFASTRLDHPDWNYPEKIGYVEIKKGVSQWGTKGTSKTVVSFIGDEEWRYVNGSWYKVAVSVLGNRRLADVSQTPLTTGEETTIASVELPKGSFVVVFCGYFGWTAAEHDNGTRRIWFHSSDTTFGETPVRTRRMAVANKSYATYVELTALVKLTAQTTLSLRASQDSGIDTNFYGSFSAMQIAGEPLTIPEISGGEDMDTFV